jgi:Amt family ammonium transporter
MASASGVVYALSTAQQQQQQQLSGSSDGGLYGDCYKQHVGDMNGIMMCIASSVEGNKAARAYEFEDWMLILCGFIVFFMQVGFAMVCAGCVRQKNVSNTLLKNMLDVCGAGIAWWSVGYAFAYGGAVPGGKATFIGNDFFFMTGNVRLSCTYSIGLCSCYM